MRIINFFKDLFKRLFKKDDLNNNASNSIGITQKPTNSNKQFNFTLTLFDPLIHPEEYSSKGAAGERYIYNILVTIFPANQVLQNVYIKKQDGKYTEIDILVISNVGIFVIESKNYKGWIFGNTNASYWTQTFKSGYKYKLFNPIIQNGVHVKAIQNLHPAYKTIPVFSIIVFSDECKLKIEMDANCNARVICRTYLKETIYSAFNHYPKIYDDNYITQLADYFRNFSRPDNQIREQHLRDVKSSIES